MSCEHCKIMKAFLIIAIVALLWCSSLYFNLNKELLECHFKDASFVYTNGYEYLLKSVNWEDPNCIKEVDSP